jgi:hypothetical protein
MATELDRFIREAQGLRGGFFDRGRPITVARAPGWVDLLGGAAPESGQLALGWPLGASSFVALQPDPEPAIRLRDGAGVACALPLAALAGADGAPHEYAEIAAAVSGRPAEARLAAAAWAALLREEFVRFPGGARVLVHPADGPGAAVSLAAALAQALVSAYGVRLAPRELGLSVRAGVRRVLGPAGDPGDLGALVSVCAPGGSLLMLHQQPAWVWGNLHLPHGAAIWALRVGEGRGEAPAAAGVAAALAYALAGDAAGLAPPEAGRRWLGYLSNLGTAPFAGRLRALLPETLRGDEFLARHGPLPGLEVAPDTAYPVRAAAALAVEEHLRARAAAALLRAAASKAQRDEDLLLVGELLAQSHGAQRDAGLGDGHADALAERVHAAGAAAGLFGARSPAAASGATLVVLGRVDSEPALRSIGEEYAAEIGLPVAVFGGSASGCSPAGTREI